MSRAANEWFTTTRRRRDSLPPRARGARWPMTCVLIRLLGLLALDLISVDEGARRTATTIRFWRRLILERRVRFIKVGPPDRHRTAGGAG